MLSRAAAWLLALGVLVQAAWFAGHVTLDFSAVDRIGPKRESGINPVRESKIGDEHGQDLATVHLPNRALIANGGWPSRELIGEWEPAALYPITWLYAVLPMRAALFFEVMFHLTLCGVGMTLLGWVEGRSLPAALLGSACLVFSGPVWGRLYPGHLSNLATLAWVPLIFALMLMGRLVPLTLALLLFLLAGHPQYVFYTAMMIALLAAVQWFPKVWRLGLAAAAAVVLALPQLVPAFEAYATSRRQQLPYAFSSSFYLPTTTAVTALNPFYYGHFDKFQIPELMNAWETSWFFGGLGAVGLATAGMSRRYALPLVMALVLALGAQTAVYDVLYRYLPVFGSFRGVSKFVLFTILFASLAAARGFDRLAWPGKPG